MYGSTPSGRAQGYKYYVTHAKINGKIIRVPCEIIDGQIPEWLGDLCVNPELLPIIRKIYSEEINQVTEKDLQKK
jgi:hypothetical protein